MPFRITTKNVLQVTDNDSWSQYIRPGKQIRPNFLRSTSLLYKILPASLGTCQPTFYSLPPSPSPPNFFALEIGPRKGLLRRLGFFLVRVPVHWRTDGHNWEHCTKRTAVMPGVETIPTCNMQRILTKILVDSCRVSLEYAKIHLVIVFDAILTSF